MSSNMKKSLEVDYLSAKKIASRNLDNRPVPSGYVLTSDGKGESNWVVHTSFATNAFGAVSINSDTAPIYSSGETLLGNTLKLTSSEPIVLASHPLQNRIHMSINTAKFITEDNLSSPYEDFVRETPINSIYTISCLKKTYFIDLNPELERTYTIRFNGANIPVGKLCTVRVFFKNGYGLGTLLNFESHIHFSTTYHLTQSYGATDLLEFTSTDRGVTWYAAVLATGFP